MLKINEQFQVREDDELNYGLYELTEVTSPEMKTVRKEWKHRGYFGKVSHALKAALNKYILQMVGQETLDCRTLLSRLEKIEDDLYQVDVVHSPKFKGLKKGKVKTKSEEDAE